MKILSTRTYGVFVSDLHNRPVTERDERKLNILRKSMKEFGYLPCFPMWTTRIGDKHQEHQLKVKDGQHRLIVAKELELPVWYVEYDREDVNIPDCANAQAVWTLDHYAASYAQRGKADYQELLKFVLETEMPIGVCVSLLWGQAAGNAGSGHMSVKSGRFTVRDRRGAARVARLVAELRTISDFATSVKTSIAVSALSKFIRIKEFDDTQLITKAKAYPHLLRKQPTTDAYLEMFQEVYNHMSRNRLPLAFLAAEESAKRTANVVGALKRVAEGLNK